MEGKTWDEALCPRSFVRLVASEGSCGCARAAVPGGDGFPAGMDGFPALSRRWMDAVSASLEFSDRTLADRLADGNRGFGLHLR